MCAIWFTLINSTFCPHNVFIVFCSHKRILFPQTALLTDCITSFTKIHQLCQKFEDKKTRQASCKTQAKIFGHVDKGDLTETKQHEVWLCWHQQSLNYSEGQSPHGCNACHLHSVQFHCYSNFRHQHNNHSPFAAHQIHQSLCSWSCSYLYHLHGH
jgi:hypothetical protein